MLYTYKVTVWPGVGQVSLKKLFLNFCTLLLKSFFKQILMIIDQINIRYYFKKVTFYYKG